MQQFSAAILKQSLPNKQQKLIRMKLFTQESARNRSTDDQKIGSTLRRVWTGHSHCWNGSEARHQYAVASPANGLWRLRPS